MKPAETKNPETIINGDDLIREAESAAAAGAAATKKVIDEIPFYKKESNRRLFKKILAMTAIVGGSVFIGMVAQLKLSERKDRANAALPEAVGMELDPAMLKNDMVESM